MRQNVLVTHGTDTLAWCLAYLTYALKKLPFNVAVTGSQLPLRMGFSDSDATANLETAVRLLGSVRAPSVFAVFNRGRVAFGGSLAKVHKWSPDAFVGREVAEVEDGDVVWEAADFAIDQARADWHLVVVRTGGTIESEKDDLGLLVPTGNVVSGYLTQNLENLFHGLTPEPVCGLDSSDMTPRMWRLLAEKIAAVAREQGAPTVADSTFSERVGVVTLDPWKTEEDYRRELSHVEGAVVAGYGGGNGNIDIGSGHSVVPAVREALAQGKPVVLASQVSQGSTDFVYKNGYALLDEGAITGAGLSVPHLQVKLAYLLGHRETLEVACRSMGLDPIRGFDLALTAGAPFRNAVSRRRYARLRGFEPASADPFFNRPFAEALEVLVAAHEEPSVRCIVSGAAHGVAELATRMRRAGLEEPTVRREWAVVLKPDTVVGRAVGTGAAVDAAKNLATLLDVLLGYKVLVFELSELGKVGLEQAVSEVVGHEPVPDFLRRFGLLVVEGGRQSVWDAGSFSTPLPRDAYLGLLEELILARTVSGARPGLFVCLGHEGYAAALARIARRLLEERREAIVAAVSRADPEGGRSLSEFFARAEYLASSLEVRRDDGSLIAASLWADTGVVHRNERPEALTVEIRPYRREAMAAPWPDEVVHAYDAVAAAHTTPTETIVLVRNPRVAMLHGDEVEEGAVYYLNWFFHQLAAIAEPALRSAGASSDPVLCALRRLPIGLEITSCTHYRDLVLERGEGGARDVTPLRGELEADAALTDVGSLAVYFRAEEGCGVVHDATVQFHPELLGVDRDYSTEELRDLPLGRFTDGLRVLLGLDLRK